MKPGRAFLLFHLRVGTRVSLRLLAPVLAVAFGFYYLLRPEFAIELAAIVFRGGGALAPGLVVAPILIIVSAAAARRITAGGDGWIGHLPARRSLVRRTASAAVLLAEIPTLGLLGAAALHVLKQTPGRAAVTAAGLMMAGAAAAALIVSNRSRIAPRAFGIIACFVAPCGNWIGLLAGAALIALADLTGDGSAAKRRRGRPPLKAVAAGSWLGATNFGLAFRAVGWRAVPIIIISAGLPGAALLFIRNNAMAGPSAAPMAEFGSVLFAVAVAAFAAAVIQKRRPVWAWARSLPISAGRRVLEDTACLLILNAVPLAAILVCAGWPLGPLAVVPTLALRSAAAIRSDPAPRWGVSIGGLAEGALAALIVALIPWSAWLFFALVPPAYRRARARERSIKAGHFDEIRHLAAGDPLTWRSQ